MLVACNIDDRQALQKCQNDALRICAKVSLKDRIRIELKEWIVNKYVDLLA